MFSGWESIAKSSWSCSMAKMKEKFFKILLPVHFLHPITSLFATGSRKISINTTGYIQIIGTEYFNLKCWPVLLSYWCLIFLALKHFSIFRKKTSFAIYNDNLMLSTSICTCTYIEQLGHFLTQDWLKLNALMPLDYLTFSQSAERKNMYTAISNQVCH